ncbi:MULTISPECIES: sugar transferase [unclassified Novosphingobium]|uniref:sugar transferase n=1 Tax=unclassified Novosphingobium TaxID=2644732 RepID=UPI0025DD3234|nr:MULTISPECIES: sugar transferase [unclassified Novosphingobium]HQV02584.1 sugar transferase [Novosphingobium sp.]
MAPNRLRLQRKSAWLNPLTQLGIAALACVIWPFFLTVRFLPARWHDYVAQNTLIACLIALVLGFTLHRSLSKLPGTFESFGILPGYLASFGLVLSGILLLRIEYTRSLLVLSFFACVVWFFMVYLVVQRKTVLRLGTIPGGRMPAFAELAGVSSVELSLDSSLEEIDAITADFRFDHSDEWEARIADFTLAGIPIYHSKDLYESLTGRTELEHLSENNFGALGPANSWMLPKQAIDWIVALSLAPIVLPVCLIAAIAVRIDSPGPSLFRQSRTGYRGEEFTVFKFRTMKVSNNGSAKAPVEELITRKEDDRITRLGRFLRFTRIDELPQLINVLRGEMSLIGPRPEATGLADWYQAEVPFYRYRHIVKPGITGWAQVNQGHVAGVDDIKLKLQYDFYYIRNFSIWLDILIVMKTVKTMLTGFGHK